MTKKKDNVADFPTGFVARANRAWMDDGEVLPQIAESPEEAMGMEGLTSGLNARIKQLAQERE